MRWTLAKRMVFLLACFMGAWAPAAEGCRTGVSRATARIGETAVALRQKTEELGASLTRAVESLRVDVQDTLSNLQQKMDSMSAYITTELGPTVEYALMGTKDSVADFVARVHLTLNKTDDVLDKTSYFVDILNVLGLVLVGGVCSKILGFDHFILMRFLLRFIEWACFFTAAVLLSAYLWRLVTGMEPSGREMVIIVIVIVQFLTIFWIVRSTITKPPDPPFYKNTK